MGRKQKRKCSYCNGTDHNVRTCKVIKLMNVDGSDSRREMTEVNSQDILDKPATTAVNNNCDVIYFGDVRHCDKECSTSVAAPHHFVSSDRYERPPVLTHLPVWIEKGLELYPSRASAPNKDGLSGERWGRSPPGIAWLKKVCEINNLNYCDAGGHGDCAYLSIIEGLKASDYQGQIPNCRRLRHEVAEELLSDSHFYATYFESPSEAELVIDPKRAKNFADFVAFTRDGSEWAQTICLYAVAELYPITLRVWSDSDRDALSLGQYETVVNIGYLSMQKHYVALLPRICTTDRLPLNCTAEGVSCANFNAQIFTDGVAEAVTSGTPKNIQNIYNNLEKGNQYCELLWLLFPELAKDNIQVGHKKNEACDLFTACRSALTNIHEMAPTVYNLRKTCWRELKCHAKEYVQILNMEKTTVEFGVVLREAKGMGCGRDIHIRALCNALQWRLTLYDMDSRRVLKFGLADSSITINIAKIKSSFFPLVEGADQPSEIHQNRFTKSQKIYENDCPISNNTLYLKSSTRKDKRCIRPLEPPYPMTLRGAINDTRCCLNCWRTNTAIYNIGLRMRETGHIGRKYGAIPWKSEIPLCLLCELCFLYIESQTCNIRSTWRYAWPSVLYTVMTDAKLAASCRLQVRQMLPIKIQEMWRQMWTNSVESPFIDRTHDLFMFNALCETMDLGFLIKAHDIFPYPIVKCPLGCFQFIEKCSAIPLMDYIVFKTGYKLGNAKPQLFNSARPDWPPPPKVFLGKFTRAATIINSDSEGLCILYCKNVHESLERQTLHPPVNPVLCENAEQGYETLAPCTVVPNIKRQQRMKTWNSSAHVISAKGGHHGISSFSLIPKPNLVDVGIEQMKANTLILTHRRDIFEQEMQDPQRRLHVEEYMTIYRAHGNGSGEEFNEDNIQKSLKSGTYISREDCYFMWKCQNLRSLQSSDLTNPSHVEPNDLFIPIVHPANEYGHNPFDSFKKLFKKQQCPSDSNDVCITLVTSLKFCLLHCRIIYNYALLEAVENANILAVTVIASIAVHEKFRSRSKYSMADKELAHFLRKHVKQNTQSTLHSPSLADVLSALSPKTVQHIVASFLSDCPALPSNEHILIVKRAPNNREHHECPPLQFAGRPLLLVMSSKICEGHAFRWEASMKWWYIKNGEIIHSPNPPESFYWNIAIYGLSVDLVKEEMLLRAIEGQTDFCCWNPNHSYFLLKESRSTDKKCYRRECKNKAAWGCHYATCGIQCCTGICRTHFASDSRNGQTVRLQSEGPIESNHLNRERVINLRQSNDMGEDSNDGTNYAFDFYNCNEDLDQYVGCDRLPLHTVPTNEPLFSDQLTDSYPSHYLLNGGFNVLQRRKRKKSSASQQNFMHYFVAKSGSPAISLFYPEAQVLPTTFWGMHNKAPVGAIPQCLMGYGGVFRGPRALRSKKDLIKIRIHDHDLPTASQHTCLHYYFDLKLNDCLNGKSSALVWKRGLENLAEKKTLQYIAEDVALPYGDYESTLKVRELAALTKVHPWIYWLTMTNNETFSPGVRNIIAAMKAYCDVPQDYTRIYASNLEIINRSWLRFVSAFLLYIVESPDQIIGPVNHISARLEFQSQSSAGNKAHVHMGVSLYDEPIEKTQQRISCDPDTVFNDSGFGVDFQSLSANGIITDYFQYESLKDLYKTLATHNCDSAGERCKKRKDDKGNFICRVPRHPDGDKYYFEMKKDLYSEDMLKRMEKIDFAEKKALVYDDGTNREKLIMTDARLVGGRHHYPTKNPTGSKNLPTIPLIQCALQSCFNASICDRRFSTSYLLKYSCGKESHGGEKQLKATRQRDIVNVIDSENCNVKITGEQIALQKRRNAKPNVFNVIEIGMYEILTFLDGSPYTYTTANFVHINTHPPEYRVWRVDNRSDKHSRRYGCVGDSNIFVDSRTHNNISEWRQFTTNQVRHAKDYMNTSLHYGNTERFNIRPPELIAISHLLKYHEIFTYPPCTLKPEKFKVSDNPIDDGLYDACGKRVKIRRSALGKLESFLKENLQSQSKHIIEHSTRHKLSKDFLSYLLNQIISEDKKDKKPISTIFVDEKCKNETIAVASTIYPSNITSFPYHFILTFGHYETELDLFESISTIKTAFVRAGLLQEHAQNQDIAFNLLRRYMDEEALHLPVSRKKLERVSMLADELFHNVVYDKDVYSSIIPPITDLSIREHAEREILEIERTRKKNLTDVLHATLMNAGMTNLPTVDDVLQATIEHPVTDWLPQKMEEANWQGFMPFGDNQREESVAEQVIVLQKCYNALITYKNPRRTVGSNKFPLIVGPPGAGKTFVLQLIAFIALSLGYRVMVLSLTSERARTLGGIHIHQAFPIQVTQGRHDSPERTFSQLVNNLQKYGTRMVLLQRTDLFIFEEIGLVSAEMYSVLDSTMRRIMNNDAPFGNKLLIANGDPCQLSPPDGSQFWTSIHLMTSFAVLALKHYVRASNDVDLQNMLTLLRKASLNHDEIEHCINILKRNSNFPSQWADVPESAMRVVATRKAEQIVIDQYLREKQCDPNITVVQCIARDEIFSGMTWKAASNIQSNAIDRNVLEPKNLCIFRGAILRLTYNNICGSPKFSQGQLCIVKSFTDDMDDDRAFISVRIVPPGQRHVEEEGTTWPKFNVSRRYTNDVVLKGAATYGRRCQFPLRYYQANTVHRVMGETCNMLATELNNEDKSKNHLRLWERSQLLVILSRVRMLKDLYFVGPVSTTTRTIRNVLSKVDFWTGYVNERLSLFAGVTPNYISNDSYPYTFSGKEISSYAAGVVYLLVSLRYPNVCYVGQTCRNLKRRLAEHNSGNGSNFTSNCNYMPWVPLAIVHDFPENVTNEIAKKNRQNFEEEVKSNIRLNYLPEEVLGIIISLTEKTITCTRWIPFIDKLVVERLGHVSNLSGTGDVGVYDAF